MKPASSHQSKVVETQLPLLLELITTFLTLSLNNLYTGLAREGTSEKKCDDKKAESLTPP